MQKYLLYSSILVFNYYNFIESTSLLRRITSIFTPKIIPGTNWCGNGDRAQSQDDLGLFKITDNCCRNHDNCPYHIEAGDTKFRLTNNGSYTKSHCNCDTAFYNCLTEANNPVSYLTGVTYFSILGPQCFKEEYPIVKCRKKCDNSDRCCDYQLDNRRPKTYQWFDNQMFSVRN